MTWQSESMCVVVLVWACGLSSTFLKLTTGAHLLSLSLWIHHPSLISLSSLTLTITLSLRCKTSDGAAPLMSWPAHPSPCVSWHSCEPCGHAGVRVTPLFRSFHVDQEPSHWLSNQAASGVLQYIPQTIWCQVSHGTHLRPAVWIFGFMGQNVNLCIPFLLHPLCGKKRHNNMPSFQHSAALHLPCVIC